LCNNNNNNKTFFSGSLAHSSHSTGAGAKSSKAPLGSKNLVSGNYQNFQ